jgi:hypothetical protein
LSDALFEVTPAMRAAVHERMAQAGVRVPRRVFDDASELVDQHLGREAVRLALGRVAETRRIVARDRVVQAALGSLRGAATTWEMLNRMID